ncbi:MAG: prepilin peptidase [Planctomycetota bacterium]
MYTPDWVWLIFISAFGACVGSFLNVVIYRLPAGQSLIHPPSQCPHCGKKLAVYDNVPVLGWIWLRGKCRYCKAPISVQYPLVEAATALLFGGMFALFYMTDFRQPFAFAGFGSTWPLFVVWCVALACLFAATVIDARLFIIPLEIPWTMTAVALVVLPVGAWLSSDFTSFGPGLGVQPFTPRTGHIGALAAWGGAIGLVLAIVLLKLGVLPDSFEGEDLDGFEMPVDADAESKPSAPLMNRVMAVLSPLGFVAGLTLSGLMGWGEGMLPGRLHVLVFGALSYLALRVPVFIWQLTRKTSEEPGADHDEDEEDIPPLKHPRKVALRELMFVGFPLVGMLAGVYLANHRVTEPLSHTGWYDVLAGVVMGYLVGGGIIWMIRIFGTLGFNKEAMGLGDIHLLAGIGAVIGAWESVFLCFFVAPFLGLGLVVMSMDSAALLRKPSRHIPYGPYLAGAAVLAMFLGIQRLDLVDILAGFAGSGAGGAPGASPVVPQTFPNNPPFVP